ncbi:CoA transferase [Burkholderiaceae bacterium]|nr:CoA transferase [Burkholderiaceae bacterium]MDG1109348.1 CaiB/BaiF CoA-transferase family protein [Burkholderiaceae bacterium]
MNHNDNQTAARTRPLEGITVIDVSRVVAGPYCAMMLADLGATVIKIEHPNDSDFVRSFPPQVANDDGSLAGSGYFAQYNRHKLGASLDLKHPDGKALFIEMISKADILIENFRPGTMAKLGLDYEVLKEANPRLIYCGISGFGQTGPHSKRPSYDSTAQAAGGLWSMNGNLDLPPVRMGSIIGDIAASFYGAIGILAALRETERSGLGQLVDISQQDAAVTMTENAIVNFTADGTVPKPLGSEHPFARPYGQYACKDGYVFFGSYSDKLWRDSCVIFGQPELINDPEIDTMVKRFDDDTYERRLKPIINSWFANRTKAELEAMAGDSIALTPIKNIDEVVSDPHLKARDMFVPVKVGKTVVEVFGSPIKLSETPNRVDGAAPAVGEHNLDVYLRWMGLTTERFDALRKNAVI